jgi:hypothetical protein
VTNVSFRKFQHQLIEGAGKCRIEIRGEALPIATKTFLPRTAANLFERH